MKELIEPSAKEDFIIKLPDSGIRYGMYRDVQSTSVDIISGAYPPYIIEATVISGDLGSGTLTVSNPVDPDDKRAFIGTSNSWSPISNQIVFNCTLINSEGVTSNEFQIYYDDYDIL